MIPSVGGVLCGANLQLKFHMWNLKLNVEKKYTEVNDNLYQLDILLQ